MKIADQLTGETVEDLLRTADNLDDDDFSYLFNRYKEPLRRFSKAKGATDPEGVAHLALFDAYRAFNRTPIRNEPAFRSYLYRAAANHTIGEFRRSTPIPADIADDGRVSSDSTNETVDRLWLEEMVEDLPPAQREVIESRFFRDQTIQESANQLGRSQGSVEQLQHRAVRRLRRATAVALIVMGVIAIAIWQVFSNGVHVVETNPADNVSTTTTPTSTTATSGVTIGEREQPVGSTNPGPDAIPTGVADAVTSAEAGIGRSSTSTPSVFAPETKPTSTSVDPSEPTLSTVTVGSAAPPTSTPSNKVKPAASAIRSSTTISQDGSSELAKPGPPTSADSATTTVQPKPISLSTKAVDSGRPVVDFYVPGATEATTPNRCEHWVTDSGKQAVMLFDPRGDAGAAMAYQPPSFIKLVASDQSYSPVGLRTGDTLGSARVGWASVLSNEPFGQSFAPDKGAQGWTVFFEADRVDWTGLLYTHKQGENVIWAVAELCIPEFER